MNGDQSVREISDKFKIPKSTIYSRIRREQWRCIHDCAEQLRIPGGPEAGVGNQVSGFDKDPFTARLFAVLDRSLAEVELSLLAAEVRNSQDRARDVRTLTTLIGVFDKLSASAPAAETQKDVNQIEQDEDLMRAEIAGRLDRLRKIRNRGTAGAA